MSICMLNFSVSNSVLYLETMVSDVVACCVLYSLFTCFVVCVANVCSAPLCHVCQPIIVASNLGDFVLETCLYMSRCV